MTISLLFLTYLKISPSKLCANDMKPLWLDLFIDFCSESVQKLHARATGLSLAQTSVLVQMCCENTLH